MATTTIYDANGNAIEVGGNVSSEEPMYGDIPRLFIDGDVFSSYGGSTPTVQYHYYSKTDSFSCYGTIKVQGASTRSYPKKNFTLKFFSDSALTTKYKVGFKNWGKRNKFVIKADWAEISHTRNICSANLWSDMIQTRSDYDSLPQGLLDSPNNGVIDGFMIVVFINGDYWGRYSLNISKDENLWGMDETSNTNCAICGEDYRKTVFQEYPSLINGNDWTDEIHDTCPASIVTSWNTVENFVRTSSDAQFMANIGTYLSLPSLIDYYIFAYVSCAIDNLGRNMVFLTYDGTFWIASVYDLDLTWGATNGSIANNPTVAMQSGYQSTINYAEGNKLFVRLEELYATEIKARYAELRADILSVQHILEKFEKMLAPQSAELIAEDYASTTATTNTEGDFTNMPSIATNNIQQIRSFIRLRLAYVDTCINAL